MCLKTKIFIHDFVPDLQMILIPALKIWLISIMQLHSSEFNILNDFRNTHQLESCYLTFLAVVSYGSCAAIA